jgi:hypothetical protein
LILKVFIQQSLILLAIVYGLLSACSGSSSSVAPGPPEVGKDRSTYIGRQEKLLAEFDGWRVWEFTDDKVMTCMAVKPVAGTPWPDFTTGTFLPRLAATRRAVGRRMVSGGAGFFMYILNDMEVPYFGFYGKHPYRLPGVAVLNGKTILDTNNQDTVLAWEGLMVSFKLNTQASETSTTLDETTGTLDFTGVNKAYQSMMQCHS